MVTATDEDTLSKYRSGKSAGKNNVLRRLDAPLYQLKDFCSAGDAPEVCVVDYLLYMYSHTCAQTFRQVLTGMKRKFEYFFSIVGTEVLIISFDKSDYVPIAKAPEQNKRTLGTIRRELGVDYKWLVYHQRYQERQEFKSTTKRSRLYKKGAKKVEIPLESVVIPQDWQPEMDEYLPEDWKLYVQDKQGARKKIVSFLSRGLLGQLEGFEGVQVPYQKYFVIDGHCWTTPAEVLQCMEASDPTRSALKLGWRTKQEHEARATIIYDTPLCLSKHLYKNADEPVERISLFRHLENKCGEADQLAFFALDKLKRKFAKFYLCSCDTDWFYYGLNYLKEDERKDLRVYLCINRLNMGELFSMKVAKGYHVNLRECVDLIRARFPDNPHSVETLLMFMVNSGGDFVNDWGSSSAYKASEALFRFGDYFTQHGIVEWRDLSILNQGTVKSLFATAEAYVTMVAVLFYYMVYPKNAVGDLLEYEPEDLKTVLGDDYPPLAYLQPRLKQLNVALFFLAQSHRSLLFEPDLTQCGYTKMDEERPFGRNNIMRTHDPLTSNL